MLGILIKILLLGFVDATSLWAGTFLLAMHNYLALGVLAVATLAINYVYLSKRSRASRWLIPGTILLLIFQVYPVIFTASTAFTNYSTEHYLSKPEAITRIMSNTIVQVDGSPEYLMTVVHKGQTMALLIADVETGEVQLATSGGLSAVKDGQVDADGKPLAIAGWKAYTGDEALNLGDTLANFRSPMGDGHFMAPIGVDSAAESQSLLKYDSAKNILTDTTTGDVYTEKQGAFYAPDGTMLTPGWHVAVGFQNFRAILNDNTIRGPFVRVLVWTFIYAFLSVVITFILGLALALILNHPRIKGRKALRSILILPYAMPGFLSVLIWAGLLNDDFGAINQVFGSHIPWLTDPFWAKVATLLVQLWLGFPYMFLITTGAIQSIPAELAEAASVDGAKPRQILMKIKLPLLMVSVTPLLIGSFAYNFNNFGGIYLLTGGGPAMEDSPIAGATDILISYTYKLAFGAGHGNDYGLACAISILIFFIVATVSTISFTRTRALENLS